MLSDDENEDVVLCKMCNKGFVSEMALLNHARVEHLDEYMAGEELCVKQSYKVILLDVILIGIVYLINEIFIIGSGFDCYLENGYI